MMLIIRKIVVVSFFIGIVLFVACSQGKFNNGVYVGRSRAIYTQEPFVGISKIYVSQGVIDSIQFSIVDTLNKELFDEAYEKHYVGNQEYINQCRNDWKGVCNYPKAFMTTKNIDNIDAVSGATWSYNIFKSATKIALGKAKKGN